MPQLATQTQVLNFQETNPKPISAVPTPSPPSPVVWYTVTRGKQLQDMQILISSSLWFKPRRKYICLRLCSLGFSLWNIFKCSSLEHICTSSLTTTLALCHINLKNEKKLNHLAVCLLCKSMAKCTAVTYLLNTFSYVQDFLFCFAVPQPILSSLISENNSLLPLDQSKDAPCKGWCTGCLPDLSLWSGAFSICSNCASSFQVHKGSLIPKGWCQSLQPVGGLKDLHHQQSSWTWNKVC